MLNNKATRSDSNLYLRSLLGYSLIFLFLSKATVSGIVLEPTEMQPATSEEIHRISNMLGENTMNIENNIYYVAYVGGLEEKFFIARVEGDNCKEDRCLTIFSSDNKKGNNIILVAFLPPKFSVYDMFTSVCTGCGNIYQLIFTDKFGKKYIVGIGADYATLLDGSLAGR